MLSAAGAYGVIYRVAPGLVAKVGFILPEEARLQQRLAACGKAAQARSVKKPSQMILDSGVQDSLEQNRLVSS